MAESVLGRQRDMGSAAVCLGDDAEAQFTVNHVSRFESISRLQGGVVRLPLRIADVAPIATGVALEVRQGIETAFSHETVDAGTEDQRAYCEQQGRWWMCHGHVLLGWNAQDTARSGAMSRWGG
mgnify:CR=1 FL=1